MNLQIAALLFALAVGVGVFALWTALGSGRNPAASRMRHIRESHERAKGMLYGEKPPWPLEFLAWLGGFLPASEGRAVLRTGLVQAGFRKPTAPLILLGFKVLTAGLLPLLWLGIGIASGRPLPQTMTGLVIAAIVGFYLPTFVVAQIRAHRRDSILTTLPDALDLMVVCVESGLGITAAMQRVALEMRLASAALSDELTLVHHEMQGGIARVDALRALAMRTGVEDIYSLVAMLIQTDRLGTSVSQALRAHADSMRVRRRQRAEQMAHKASVKLAFPLVLLIFPALLVVILGPAMIQLMRSLIEHS